MNIYNKRKFENNCWVGEVNLTSSNNTESNRLNTVTNIASICKGNLKGVPNDRKLNVYERLLTEAAGEPGTSFEFIPVIIGIKRLEKELNHDQALIQNKVLKYGIYVEETEMYGAHLLTNLRALLKVMSLRDIPYNNSQSCAKFRCIVGRIPWKALYHLDRSRAFVFNEETSRNKKFREEIEFYIDSTLPTWQQTAVRFASKCAFKLSQWLIDKGVRAEIANMFIPDNRLVKFAMCAWMQDTNAWDTLFKQRANKTGTMNITSQVVNNIKSIIYG